MHSMLVRYLEQLQHEASHQVANGNVDFAIILADISDPTIRSFIRRFAETALPLSEHYTESEVKYLTTTGHDLASLAAQVEGQFQNTDLSSQSLNSTTDFLALLLLPGHVETASLPLPDPE